MDINKIKELGAKQKLGVSAKYQGFAVGFPTYTIYVSKINFVFLAI